MFDVIINQPIIVHCVNLLHTVLINGLRFTYYHREHSYHQSTFVHKYYTLVMAQKPNVRLI